MSGQPIYVQLLIGLAGVAVMFLGMCTAALFERRSIASVNELVARDSALSCIQEADIQEAEARVVSVPSNPPKPAEASLVKDRTHKVQISYELEAFDLDDEMWNAIKIFSIPNKDKANVSEPLQPSEEEEIEKSKSS